MVAYSIYAKNKSGSYCYGKNTFYLVGENVDKIVELFNDKNKHLRIETLCFIGDVEDYCFK